MAGAAVAAAAALGASAAWACAPLYDSPYEFKATPTNNVSAVDSASKAKGSTSPTDILIAGYVLTNPSYPIVDTNNTSQYPDNVYLDNSQISYWQPGVFKQTCSPTDTPIGHIPVTMLQSQSRAEVHGTVDITTAQMAARSIGTYLVCHRSQLTFWADPITVTI